MHCRCRSLFVLQLVIRQLQESSVDRILNVASGKARELDTLTQLLRHLESGAFSAERLVTLRGMLATPVPASGAIGSLQRLAERYAWRHSLPLVPVAFVGYAFTGADWALDAALVCASAFVLFTPFLALAVERWRRLHGPHVGGWMAALGEFEATLALAGYHFEHPQDPFPVIDEGGPEQARSSKARRSATRCYPQIGWCDNDVQLTAGCSCSS